MTGNFGSQGASGMNTPVLPGYTVTWDETAGEWVATSDRYGTVLRGRTGRELELARNARVVDIADDLKRIFAYSTTHGYSPPPRS